MHTVFRNVARAGGRDVADPECLRLREEGETGDDGESDNIRELEIWVAEEEGQGQGQGQEVQKKFRASLYGDTFSHAALSDFSILTKTPTSSNNLNCVARLFGSANETGKNLLLAVLFLVSNLPDSLLEPSSSCAHLKPRLQKGTPAL